MSRLEGRVAVVTGAGGGIGRGIAARFAAEGAVVCLTDLDGERAEEAAIELRHSGHNVTAMAVDVSRGQDVSAMFRAVDQAHGRIDVLVNNAGINVRSDFRHLSDADWERIREVNLDGVVRIARDGFKLLRKSGRGSLINISSVMGGRGLRQLAGYSATKGAVIAAS